MKPRVRTVVMPDGQQVSVIVGRFAPPWSVASTARRLRRLETYHQLAETLAAYDADGPEHRRAEAMLAAQVALDNIDAAERNTTTVAIATWALVFTTAALVAATIALIIF